MNEDPRRAVVQVIGRLGRETQFHLDERYRHFRITDLVIIVTSLLLVILAVFNVYFIRVLYVDLNGIVHNMDSMHGHLSNINEDMDVITKRMDQVDKNVSHMAQINGNMSKLTQTMPRIRNYMGSMTHDISGMEESMRLVNEGMGIIDQRVYLMTGGVATIRQNMRQFARPMGSMGSFIP